MKFSLETMFSTIKVIFTQTCQDPTKINTDNYTRTSLSEKKRQTIKAFRDFKVNAIHNRIKK